MGEAPLVSVESDRPLHFSITPSIDTAETPTTPEPDPSGIDTADEGLRIVVTADDERPSYLVPETSIGARIEASILDVPQSVQVVPQQIIEEQGVTTINEALRNAAGVSPGRVAADSPSVVPVIREFATQNVLRNGLRDETFGFGSSTSLTNVERLEILRGPASVLYGQGNLGGTLNLITEQPLNRPRYELHSTLGQFDQQLFVLDLTGPLNAEKSPPRSNDSSEEYRKFPSSLWLDKSAVKKIRREKSVTVGFAKMALSS